MMIDLCNRLVDNDLTKEDLLENVVVETTTLYDAQKMCEIIAKSFALSSVKEAVFQLTHSNVLLNHCVKLVDKRNGDIYGLLTFCEYPVQEGSPILSINPDVAEYLSKFKQINGHSFIIDERLRGCNFDKKMIVNQLDFLMDNYDLIWCAVEKDLKSHNYWKKFGFIELLKIPEATFYARP